MSTKNNIKDMVIMSIKDLIRDMFTTRIMIITTVMKSLRRNINMRIRSPKVLKSQRRDL